MTTAFPTEKSSDLKLVLKADSGFNSTVKTRISVDQWRRICGIIEEEAEPERHPEWRKATFGFWQPRLLGGLGWSLAFERMMKDPVFLVDDEDLEKGYWMNEDEALVMARAMNARAVHPESDPPEGWSYKTESELYA